MSSMDETKAGPECFIGPYPSGNYQINNQKRENHIMTWPKDGVEGGRNTDIYEFDIRTNITSVDLTTSCGTTCHSGSRYHRKIC